MKKITTMTAVALGALAAVYASGEWVRTYRLPGLARPLEGVVPLGGGS